jgi:hypothetical protein
MLKAVVSIDNFLIEYGNIPKGYVFILSIKSIYSSSHHKECTYELS